MDPTTTQARVVVDEWVRGGVTDVVACPGSRNAPLLLAVHAAAVTGALRLHVRIDERSAGFLALGLAVRSGRVVPVVVTSGTAVANLHPAVLEASYSGVGLLAVCADRPLDLVGTGANQTVDQVGLFGSATRAVVVLPLAEDRPGVAGRWRSAVARALERAAGATTADPGPVQLDVPLREPLVPDAVPGELPADARGRPDGAPWTRVAPRTPRAAPLALDPHAPTLVVAGDGADPATVLPPGVPVVAEPTSPLWARGLRAGPWLVAALLADPAPSPSSALSSPPGLSLPRQVVVLGRPTLHRSVSRLLADPRVTVHAVPATSGTGPGGRARPGWTDVAGVVASVGELPEPGAWGPDPAWGRAWAVADAAAAHAVAAALAAEPHVTGPGLAAALTATLTPGSLFVTGSSNPVRDVALAAGPRDDVHVLGARGVSGIDGAVSFATGAALAHRGPAVALLGDVTFLHDSGGLLAGPTEPRPDLVVVVGNDNGGSIFAGLEPGAPAHAAAFERMFATPHGTDLAALCHAHGVGHRRLDGPGALHDPAGLAAAVAPRGDDGPGIRVVEVGVDRVDRRALSARLAAVAREAAGEAAAAPS